MSGYHHFTYEERLKIEALYKSKVPVKEIAQNLNVHNSSVYRELKRGEYQRMDSQTLNMYLSYSADIAQKKYDYNKTSKGPQLKIESDYRLAEFIEDKIINCHYSPDVVAYLISQQDFSVTLCRSTIYRYIDIGVFLHLTNNHLLLKAKKKPKSAPITRVNKINKNNRSIELRPKFIDERKEFGHWEMDTVIGKRNGKHSCLLVLTERMTRYEIIKKINGKTQFDVLCALNDMERKYQNFNDVFKTITIDNGTEFSCQSLLERSCINPDMNRFVAYFCHPYSSFERGSNENQNRIIRRFIPKGSDIDKYSDKDIKHIENWVNTYPRRILNFASPAELFNKYVNC